LSDAVPALGRGGDCGVATEGAAAIEAVEEGRD
jgi:hypothetical protein